VTLVTRRTRLFTPVSERISKASVTLEPAGKRELLSLRGPGNVEVIFEGNGDPALLVRVTCDGQSEEFPCDEFRYGFYSFKVFRIEVRNPADSSITGTYPDIKVMGIRK